MKYNLTAEQLRVLLSYDPDTGIFRRLVRTSNSVQVGDIAGGDNKKGYVKIRVFAQLIFAHRLAWLHHYGCWPDGEIDHINGLKSDNMIENLRVSDRSENIQNLRKAHADNVSGFLGVKRNGIGWAAKITINYEDKYLGTFKTPELAHAAYLKAKKELHPFQTIV